MIIAPVHEYNACHEPPGTPSGGRFCSDAEMAAGRAFFGWGVDKSKGYTVPDTSAHPVARDGGLWGSSHGNSWAMTGHAARLMGIPDYGLSTTEWDKRDRAAERFVAAIAADTVGSEEVLYHGFENVVGTRFKPGDTLRLPLMAAAGDSDTASYGIRSDAEDQVGDPTLFVFPKGTSMVAYSKWKPADAKDFGHVYSEAIVAGGFRVKAVREVLNPAWQHDRQLRTAHHVFVTVVELEQVETFVPGKGWVPRG